MENMTFSLDRKAIKTIKMLYVGLRQRYISIYLLSKIQGSLSAVLCYIKIKRRCQGHYKNNTKYHNGLRYLRLLP